jgi:hypothetical protein
VIFLCTLKRDFNSRGAIGERIIQLLIPMPSRQINIATEVRNRIPNAIFKKIWGFVREKEPALWGEKKPKGYLKKNFLLALYKDLYGKGYSKLMMQIGSKDRMHNSTFQHNVKVLRGVLAEWGRTQVELGTPEDWASAASDLDLPKSIEDVTLWIDSVDFPFTKRKDRKSKQGSSWSYNATGQGRDTLSFGTGTLAL